MPKKAKAGPRRPPEARPTAPAPAGARWAPRPPPRAGAAPAAAVAPSAPEETGRPGDARVPGHLHELGRRAEAACTLKEETFRKRGKGEVPDVPIDLVHVREGEPWPLSVGRLRRAGRRRRSRQRPAGAGAHARRRAGRPQRHLRGAGRRGRRAEDLPGRRAPYEIDVELAVGGGERGRHGGHPLPGLPGRPTRPAAASSPGGEVFESRPPGLPRRRQDRALRRRRTTTRRSWPGRRAGLGLDQHYFVSALLPQSADGTCFFAKAARAGERLAGLRIPVDRAGPKPPSSSTPAPSSSTCSRRATARDLETAIDYGPVTNFFAFFARILLWVMRWFHGFVANWGVAIILLTLTVKVLLYPLTVKSMQSMKRDAEAAAGDREAQGQARRRQGEDEPGVDGSSTSSTR